LTVVSAPAGYGKSTVLSEWGRAVDEPVAWVSLDENDTQAFSFWTHILTSMKPWFPVLEHAVQSFNTLNEKESCNSLLAALINSLYRSSTKIVLIWDDFHHIENHTILEGIHYLLERLPVNVHIYIAGRKVS